MPPIRVLQIMPAIDAGGMETFVMNVYSTIDREKVATHMLELGVDDLITDKPDMVQDLLARNQQVDDSLIDFRDLLNALLHPEQPADSSDDAEETITDAVEDPEEFVDAA